MAVMITRFLQFGNRTDLKQQSARRLLRQSGFPVKSPELTPGGPVFLQCEEGAGKGGNSTDMAKGETLELSPEDGVREGIVLVTVSGYPLGFAKKSGTMLKNRYLPGWRFQGNVDKPL